MSEKRKRVAELAPSPHLEAADIGGEEVVVTIKTFDWHPVGEDRVIKGILYFQEFDRGMVINKTNRVTLQHLFGEFLDELVGKRMTLYASETQFGGKVVPCLRIRAQKPAEAKSKETAKQEVVA